MAAIILVMQIRYVIANRIRGRHMNVITVAAKYVGTGSTSHRKYCKSLVDHIMLSM